MIFEISPVEKLKTISENIASVQDAEQAKNATAELHTLNEAERSDVLKQVEQKLEGMDATQKELIKKSLQELERDIRRNQETKETAVQVAFTGSLLDKLRAQLPTVPTASAPESLPTAEKKGFMDGAIDTAAKIPENIPYIKEWTKHMSREGKALTGAALTLGVGVGVYYLLKRLFGRGKDAVTDGKEAVKESKGGFFKKILIGTGIGLGVFFGLKLYTDGKLKKIHEEAVAAAKRAGDAMKEVKGKAEQVVEAATEKKQEIQDSGVIEAQKLALETKLITSGLLLINAADAEELKKTPAGKEAVEGLLKNNAFRELSLDTIALAARDDGKFVALAEQLGLKDQVQINALKFLCIISSKHELEVRKGFAPGHPLKVSDLFDALSSTSKTIARLGEVVKGKNLLDPTALTTTLKEVFESGEGEVSDTTESAKEHIRALNPALKGKELSFMAFCNAFGGNPLTDKVGDDTKADVPEFRKGIDAMRTWFEQDTKWKDYLKEFTHEERFTEKLDLTLDINTAMKLYVLLSKLRKPDGSYPSMKETPAHYAFPLQLQVLRLLSKTDPNAGQKMKFYLFFQGAEKASKEALGFATNMQLPPQAQEFFATAGKLLFSATTSKIDDLRNTVTNAGEEFLQSERGIQILLGGTGVVLGTGLISHNLFLKYPQMAVAFANAEGDAARLAALGKEYQLSSRAVEFLARKAKESRDAVARLKDVRKGFMQYFTPEGLLKMRLPRTASDFLPYRLTNAWERFMEGRSFRRRVKQQRRIDARNRSTTPPDVQAPSANPVAQAADEVADTVPFVRDADPATTPKAPAVVDEGGPVRKLDPDIVPEPEAKPKLTIHDPDAGVSSAAAEVDEVVKPKPLLAQLDDARKAGNDTLVREILENPEFKTLAEHNDDAAKMLRASRWAKGVKYGGMAFTVLINAYLLWEQENKIAAETNPQIRNIYEQERTELITSALGTEAVIALGLRSLPAAAGGWAALGATGVLAAPIIGAQMYTSAVRESIKDWAKSAEDWTEEDSTTLLQRIKEMTAEGAEGMSMGHRAAHGQSVLGAAWSWITNSSEEVGEEQAKNVERVNWGVRGELFAAYFLKNTYLPPMQGETQELYTARLKEHVGSKMKYIEFASQGRFDNVLTSTLDQADMYAELTALKAQKGNTIEYTLSDGAKRTLDLSILDQPENPDRLYKTMRLIAQYRDEYRTDAILRQTAFAATYAAEKGGDAPLKIKTHLRQQVLRDVANSFVLAERTVRESRGSDREKNAVRFYLRDKVLVSANALVEDMYAQKLTPEQYKARVEELKAVPMIEVGRVPELYARTSVPLSKTSSGRAAMAERANLDTARNDKIEQQAAALKIAPSQGLLALAQGV